MKIEVRCRGIEASDALREHAVRRIHFQLGRFNGKVGSVVVRIGDVNGPRGGLDKRCLVTARGPALASIIIEQLSTDPCSAVDLAVARAARAVGRELARARTAPRAGANGRAS